MSAEQERGERTPPAPSHDQEPGETLTDLIDRMDREAFRRSLELRDSRLVGSTVQRSR